MRKPRKKANVASLFGQAIPSNGDPNAEVVDRLEKLLERARAGLVISVGYAAVETTGFTEQSFVGNARSSDLVASVARLYHRVMEADTRDD